MTNENQNQEVKITYVHQSCILDDEIKQALAGSDLIIPVASDRFYRASNYLNSFGIFREHKIDKESNIKRTSYALLEQSIDFIKNGALNAEAIIIRSNLKDLARAIELLSLPHISEISM